jgi:hypothetical protein
MREDRTLDKLRAQIELALYVDPTLQSTQAWAIGARWTTLTSLIAAINASVHCNCTKCDLLNVAQLFATLVSDIRLMQITDIYWCQRCGKVGRFLR